MGDEERRRRLRALTPEQRAIFRLLCVPTPRKEIARLRSMTVAGVDYHCDRIADKLGLRNAARRRNAVAFRLALLAFLPALLALEEGDVPPAPEAADPPREAEPAPDPALLATIDAMAALARRDPATLATWPAADAGMPGGVGPTARPAFWRWWRPLAFFLVLALAAGMAGGIAAAHLLGGGSTGPSPSALPASTATPTATGSSVQAAAGPSPVASPPVPTAAPTATRAAGTSTSAASPTTPPARAPTVIVGVDPVATPLDLAGMVASDAPGTPLVLGRAVRSVLDPATKPRDVYTIALPAGERFRPVVKASSTRFTVTLGPADAPGAATLCNGLMLSSTCDQPFPVAAGGTYRLTIAAIDDSLRYTLQPATLPIVAPPGVDDLVGRVASNLPGTPLGLGRPVLSVVDGRSKPYDVYTLALRAGQTLRVQVSAVPADEVVRLLPPGAAPFSGAPSPLSGTQLCFAAINLGRCDASAPIAASGAYTLIVATDTPGVQYTVQATAQ